MAREIDQGQHRIPTMSAFHYPNSPANALDEHLFPIAAGRERSASSAASAPARPRSAVCSTAFYPPSEGSILVDGVDIRQYDPADLRAGIGFVLQDTDLFYGKLRDNITLGRPDATDEEVLAAARLSGVETFIAGHPQGYDMPIAEGGR